MIEKSISLGVIDPLEFYGINNSKLDVLKELFPKLSIVG
jgi:phosphate starvation-inducible PhoH-like protein